MMDNWSEVITFLAQQIRDAETMRDYYAGEITRLRAENKALMERLAEMEVAAHAEDSLEAAR